MRLLNRQIQVERSISVKASNSNSPMPRTLPFFVTLLFLMLRVNLCAQERDYSKYHNEINEAEKLIAEKNYGLALERYEALIGDYEFLFQRDCKIAAQLSAHQNRTHLTFKFLTKGVLTGWELKDIRKNKSLKKIIELPEWQAFEDQYDQLRVEYEAGLNSELSARVKKMYSKDQKKAMGALFRIGSKSQDNYAENKFAPHSEQQIKGLRDILLQIGYPGEKLIGNDFWVSTILSHHNSISEAYNKKDTLYPELKPLLTEALSRGEVSPFELALIDEWYRSTLGQGSYVGYGILDPPSKSTLEETNALRAAIFLRSVETRNGLVERQEETGIDFYLPGEGWIEGKIEIVP